MNWHYYNDANKFCCKVLRARIADGSLPDGYVDERDIREVAPADLVGFTQCHFFAGVGGFPLGIKWAGAERLQLWTAGVPCQPASTSGRQLGSADERWLWPAFLRLVRQCRPLWLLAENVPGLITLKPHGLEWVCREIENAGYEQLPFTCRASDVLADHQRKRVWILANAGGVRQPRPREPESPRYPAANPFGEASGLVDAFRQRALPYVCRGHDGISAAMDRNHALGNAVVVPLVGHIARAILESEVTH